jgi:hypothetical protein
MEGTVKTQTYDYTFQTNDTKQPLIFEGTEENPKTGFSYMSLEEIEQLEIGQKMVPWEYDGDRILSRINKKLGLKIALLELEKIFDYKILKDGTMQKNIRTKKINKIVDLHAFGVSVGFEERRILYEQLCYIFIEYFVPYTFVDTSIQGTTLEKINAMYLSNTPDADRIFWITNKPDKRKKEDQAYIREALLRVSEKEFNEVYGLILLQFGHYGYIGKDGQYYIGTVAPTNQIKKFYGIK